MIVDVAFGFLGSGKTTFIERVLQEWGTDEKIVVLVNEFGDVGIDGEILSAQGGNVVEMPSGCICCTLQADFRNQILEICRSLKPDRIIIEPSGVATISTIDWILKAQMLESFIDRIHKILIVDATGFKSLYKANRQFVESQVQSAHLILLNKCDRVDKRAAMLTQSAISSINPEPTVLTTEYASVNWQEYRHALSAANPFSAAASSGSENTAVSELFDHHHDQNTKGPILSHFHETADALGYESFGSQYQDYVFDPEKLRSLFQSLNTPESGFGEVVRAKGIFCIGEKWMVLEQASGEISTQPIRPFDSSKITVIGKNLDRKSISSAFEQCGAAAAPVKKTEET